MSVVTTYFLFQCIPALKPVAIESLTDSLEQNNKEKNKINKSLVVLF